MKVDNLQLLIAKTINRELFTKREITDDVSLLLNAASIVLKLPHPKLTCTIGEALEKALLMVRRIHAQEKMLTAYRLGSGKLAEKVFVEIEHTRDALTLSDGHKIEVKK